MDALDFLPKGGLALDALEQQLLGDDRDTE